jgi:hypothetical protein
MRASGVLIRCAVVLVALFVLGAAGRPEIGEYFEPSVRHLQRAVHPQRDGGHLPRLFALRQMRDPDLRPLFYQLAQRDDWQVQVHAALGLAEISPERRIDPWLVTQIDPRAQEALIANAIDMDLIGADEIRELMNWDDLEPLPHLMLAAELMLMGEPVLAESVAKSTRSANHQVAGLASLLLAELGDATAFTAYIARLEGLPKADRDRHTTWLCEAVRQYELRSALPWITEHLRLPSNTRDSRYWCIYTVLVLDAEEGAAIWRRELGDDPAYRDRVRYGMLLLGAAEDVAPDLFDTLRPDEPDQLIERMIATGQALARGGDPSDELIKLIELEHPKTANWAFRKLKELPDDQAATVYTHIIKNADRDGVGRAERAIRAATATARLHELDPAAVLALLAAVEDDSPIQEVMLLGLLDTREGVELEAIRRIRRIGAGLADSLALLLLARHADALEGDDLRQLGVIAAGGGRVSIGLQAEAAWLYLKHTGAVDQALSRVFDEAP